MGWTNISLFLASSWLLILTPGPDMLYVITRGLGQGRRAGVISAFGVACGILVHTLLAGLGLALVLRTSSMAFAVVKYAGAGYLVYLGLRSLLTRKTLRTNTDGCRASSKALFLQGLLTNVLNPKIALFFLAFLPQFVTPGQMNTTLQMMLLGLCYAFCSTFFLVSVSLFSGSVGSFINKNNRFTQTLTKVSGGVFIALGVKLCLAKQPGIS